MSEGTVRVEREDKPSGPAASIACAINGHLAEMTFSRASDKLIIIDHTDVPEALRGQRVGNLLLEKAIADARAEGLQDLSRSARSRRRSSAAIPNIATCSPHERGRRRG